MNQKNQKKMDKKKSKGGKRRKSNAGKRHGRAEPEEKPKTAEVMNEKEKQERLEAASVLSSLRFLPPKSSEDNENSENGAKSDLVTPSSMVTQITLQATTSGIPATSHSTAVVLGGRGSPGTSAISESAANLKNSMILAQLQNQLSLALKNKNVHPVVQPQTHPAFAQNTALTVRQGLNSKLTNDKSDSQNVPLTVLKQNLTINKNVAKALRQAVSNNKLKAENPVTEILQGRTATDNVPDAIVTNNEQEKMDCESLPSSRKTGGTDNNLPLKKRRLIGMTDETLTTSDLNLNSTALSSRLDTLASAQQIENILQMAKDYPASSAESALSLVTSLTQTKVQEGAGYRPVQFDPRTSLMVLSDLKFALTPDEDGDLPIHIAVVHENIELVKKFIDIMAVSGKTVDRFNKLQQTPLHLAVLVNKPDIVSVLLIAGANPNLLDRHGCTSVHISVNKNHPQCMEMLFKESKVSVNLNTRDYEGYYPLHTCVELDNFKMMETLVTKGADVDSQDGKAGRSVLLYAVEYYRVRMVPYLLEHGATPDLQNYASVTPMMTAQAANHDDIVACLNKALDIGCKYEESYIPTKKVPVQIAKFPLKGFQNGSKDRNVRHSFSGEMPLIYEEYNAGPKPQSVSENLKKEPLSRQSSVSSPIDLSMRHNTKSPSQSLNEMSIRGKPGRRKTKKEHKNHKEKQPQKSMLKEKHASVVAALERSMFADQHFPRKMNDKGSVMDYKLLEPYIKVEAQDSEYEEMERKTEKGDKVDTENVKSNLPSATLNDLILNLKPEFILNLKPDQTKCLVEKVRQQLNVHKDQTTIISPNEFSISTAEYDSNTSEIVQRHENDPGGKHQDLKPGDGKDEPKVTEIVLNDKDKYYGKVVSLKDYSVTNAEDIEMTEKAESDKEMVKGGGDSSLIVSQPEVKARSSEVNDNDCDNDSMDRGRDEREKNSGQQTAGSFVGKFITQKESNINLGKKSITKSNENETNKFDKLVHKVNLHENVKSCLKERIVNRSENSKTVLSKFDSQEKFPNNVEFVSQVSQESGSSSSLQGSQDSHGFEVMSSPVLNGVQSGDSGVLGKVCTEAEHSEDSMEIEFTSDTQGLNQEEEAIRETEVDGDKSNNQKVKLVDNEIDTNDGSESMVIDEEKKAMPNIDTDEDDEESSLVIDEHVEDETETNDNDTVEMSDKNASEYKNLEANSEKVDTSDMNDMEARHAGLSEASEETNEKIWSEDGKSLQVCNGEHGEENDKDKNILLNSDKASKVTEQDVSNSKTIRNIESPSLILPEDPKSDAKLNAQGMKEGDYKVETGAVVANQSLSQEEMLKKGQSHTLFYHDGGSFKPIKIFIDNSEQSSLVLQRMFQSAQLANVNMQTGPVTASDISKTSETSASISDARNLVTNVTTNQTIPTTNISVTGNNILGKVSENVLHKAASPSKSSSNSVESIPVTSIKQSGLVTTTSLSGVVSQQSFQQAYINSLKQKEETSVKNSSIAVKPSRKRTTFSPNKSDTPSQIKAVSQSAKVNVCNSSRTFDTQTVIDTFPPIRKVQGAVPKPFNAMAGKYTSEGTLTHVSPEIRSKLSKALLSQKKTGLVRSDSEDSIVNSKSVLTKVVTSVPATVQTSVIDSRQQL